MPVVLVQGRTAHVSRCFDGLNAVGVLGRMFEKTELSAEFAEVFDGEVCMPPTWLNFKDLKKEYDVSVPARAAGYLSVLSFRSGPGEILEKMRELGSEAFAEYIEKMDAERRRLEEKLSGRAMQGKKKCVKTAKPQAANAESVDHADPVSEEYADNVGECKKTNDVVPQKFNVLSFEELSEQCRKKNADGFEDFLEGLKGRTEARIRSGETNYPPGDYRHDDGGPGLVRTHRAGDGHQLRPAALPGIPQRSDDRKRGRRKLAVQKDQESV